jgi:5,10-methylenetetrahydromethanopterin reductase
MQFGINLAPTPDSWKIVKRAEELGFDCAWFIDSQMINTDLFVAMAAAAVETSRIRLGTGVLIPSNRIAPVAANALASLNALAPGRIRFGISTGFTGRRAMGLGPIRLAEMEEYIRIVQALLRRETVEWDFEGKRRKIRFLNPDIDLVNTTDPIPLYVSAFGPKGQALTAMFDAGWINSVGNVERAADAVSAMRRSWRDSGRDASALEAVAVCGGCVLRPGERYDSPRAKAQAGPAAAIALHSLAEQREFPTIGLKVPPHLEKLLDEYLEIYLAYRPEDARYLSNHRGHLMFLRPEEQHLIGADLIRQSTITGTVPEVREKIRGLRDAGYTQFSTHVRYGQPSMLDDWAEVISGL